MIMPRQWAQDEEHVRRCPNRRLYAAVLERAVRDAFYGWEDAAGWIGGNAIHGAVSFADTCNVLGIDENKTRDRINENLRKRHSARYWTKRPASTEKSGPDSSESSDLVRDEFAGDRELDARQANAELG